MSYIKLSKYAKNNGICYKTAYNHWNKGMLRGKKLETGTILIEVEESNRCVIYSTKTSFDPNIVKLASGSGFSVDDIIIEKNISDKFKNILSDISIKTILVDYKTSKTIDNLDSIKILLESNNRVLKILKNI